MATSPPTNVKPTATAGSSGWVLEAQGKDPGSLNLTREISNDVITHVAVADMNLFTTSNTTAVSGTSLGASVAKHQLMITGGAEDYANIGVSNWTLSTTVVTYGTHQYKVYNANSSVYAQMLIDQNIVNAGHVL
jgi:hypothetical protein